MTITESHMEQGRKIYRDSVSLPGTSNVINFLPLDRSGNRRFLPIMCDASKAEVHILENEAESRVYIEQMWAEMMALYGDGKIRLKLPKEIEKNLIEYQRPFMQERYLDRIDSGVAGSYFKSSGLCATDL